MKEVAYNEYAKEAIKGLGDGAFLNVTSKGKDNVMSVGWGSISYMWNRPVVMVMVRFSRHTYSMLDEAGEFVVSIPFDDKFKKELKLFGTKSGRDMDKIEEMKLPVVKGNIVNAPLVKGCDLHYECRVIYKQAMEPAALDKSIKDQYYSTNDFHVLFYGEILGTYKED